MAEEERLTAKLLTPALLYVYDFMVKHPCEWLRVRDVREPLGLTNGAARYRLTKLAELGFIKRYTVFMFTIYDPVSRRRRRIRAIYFHYIPPVIKELARVSIALYIIISEGEKEYFISTRKGQKVKRRYPKGAFQSFWQCDAFISPETREIKTEEEPFPTILTIMRDDTIAEFLDNFNVNYDPDDLVLGETSEVPEPGEIGKPPYKIRIERTVEGEVPSGASPTSTWRGTEERYVLTTERYLAIFIDPATGEPKEQYRQYWSHLQAIARGEL